MSPRAKLRHFLKLSDLSADELRAIIKRASELRAERERGESQPTLLRKVLAMVFEEVFHPDARVV